MASLIRFLLSNYFLTFFIVGLAAAALSLLRGPRPWTRTTIAEALLAYDLLFAIGLMNFYNFVMHVFFGAMAARFIGWADSPFQLEVATASLGFALVGFIAAFRSFDLRLAAIIGPSVFTLGAAVGHVREMITAHNFAPGNAGVIFYMDIAIPVIGGVLLALQHRYGRPGPSRSVSATT